ncbi:MAG: hypothetical protein EHM34_09385 [Nitrosopumilales archaeon]|nr:MAG: hypothetical protein EHM34_09385 [Nitrosopumilales archaeon]
MDEIYYVIQNSDGDTTVRTCTKEEILKEINEGEIGDVLTQILNSDTNYWGESVLIIKGRMVAPKAEKVITKYNID